MNWTLIVTLCVAVLALKPGSAQGGLAGMSWDSQGGDLVPAKVSQGMERLRSAERFDGFALLSGDESGEPGHELGNITGTNIDMKVYDHAFAGAIKDFVAWGFLDESTGVSTLIMRRYGQVIQAEFKKQEDGTFGGTIKSGEGATGRTTSVTFSKVDAPARTFYLKIDNEEISVAITSEGYEGGHFLNPTYSTVLRGQEISYRMDGGACFGLSIHVAMMILGAYAH